MITTLTHNPALRHSSATQQQSTVNDIAMANDIRTAADVSTSARISGRGLKATDLLNWRYATQKFDENRKIDAQTWNEMEESLRLTPSAFGLQPWKFVVITDERSKNNCRLFLGIKRSQWSALICS